MCTLTHFTYHSNPGTYSPLPLFQHHSLSHQARCLPRFRVVLAGIAFFHIKETSTGRVRGFRSSHNEACALARSLEARA
jgi:hypothetical protein